MSLEEDLSQRYGNSIQEEYFDDAGDVGYLPADHVSYTFSKNKLDD